MNRFSKKTSLRTPELSTASLPDIVFMLLFFFMTVTVMKSTELNVLNELPNATEIKRLENKDRVIEIHVGKPSFKYRSILGDEPRIQLNDKFADISEVAPYVLSQIQRKPKHVRAFVVVSLKVDKRANMGLISDIKKELRKINALKINYTTYEGDAFKNIE
ncbi:biopolymer transporter ExbD [Aurantibacter sp.]|uniref:ExbD/TolR family protein n=1 Tax=Aurantibacter sp. TaxID=2807103 RepID=UPI00326428FB